VFVLAHLSDPHLGPLPLPRLSELASKRLLGYANWRRSRHAVHRSEALEAIVADIRRSGPDHVAVTGDLVNIALPYEFERARRWLEGLGAPDRVSLVPGNHDAYVGAAARDLDRHWAPYMAADEQPADAPPFPSLRRRGGVALVGLSTAVPTPLLMATGRLGESQIAHAIEMLARLGQARMFRVVMIHHPPVPEPWRHKRLIDAAPLRAALAAAGAELVIHGHDHVRSLAWLPGQKDMRIPVIGVPSASASAAAGAKHQAAGYNLYRIGGGPGAWSCEVISRSLQHDKAVAELKRFDLSWSQH
jgi:3',5'-cyclic AMP phosphodiesterase CpdA